MTRALLALLLLGCGAAPAPVAPPAVANAAEAPAGTRTFVGQWEAHDRGDGDAYFARFEFTDDGEFTWAQSSDEHLGDACPSRGAYTLGAPRAGDLPVLELRPRATTCNPNDYSDEVWRWQPMTWTADRIELLSAQYEFADPTAVPRSPADGGAWLLLERVAE